MTRTMARPALPSGMHVTADDVQAVWDRYVKPDQEAEVPPSGEMRMLMAILRAVYAAYGDATPEDATLALPAPLVWPFGWEVDHPQLVGEVQDTFLTTDADQGHAPRDRPQLALAAILTAVKDALR